MELEIELYEAALRHEEDGRLAVLAVKSGGSNPVPVGSVVESVQKEDAEVFVFSTHNIYERRSRGATAMTAHESSVVERRAPA